MLKWCVLAAAGALVLGLAGSVRADDAADAKAIVDKAVKAMGGEEALAKARMVSWKSKTTISFNGNDNVGATAVVLDGVDHYRQDVTGSFNGNDFHLTVAVSGDKGVRKFGGNSAPLEGDALAEQKRTAYLTAIPVMILPLRDKAFKLAPIAEVKVGDKPAAGLNVTAPDKKEFKIYFDKESGLPVRMIGTVRGFGNQGEFMQTMDFSEYKDTGGIKKAMKLVAKREETPYLTQEITEFKVLDKVDPKT